MMPAELHTINWTLKELLDGIIPIGAEQDCYVEGIALDHRQIKPGFVFIALLGSKQHGLQYTNEAIRSGAVAVLWESQLESVSIPVLGESNNNFSVPTVGVKNLRAIVGLIADKFYNSPSKKMHVVGITGTNGKTSCAQFLAAALHGTSPCGVIGTLGNGVYTQQEASDNTTPSAIEVHNLMYDFNKKKVKNVVMEVSSHGIDQGRVTGIDFDTAVFTNLTRDHLDYHGTMESYARAKRRLFEMECIKNAVINLDDPYSNQLLITLSEKVNLIGYGTKSPREELTHSVIARDVALSIEGIQFKVESSWGNIDIKSPLLGRFNVSNLLAVMSALLIEGIPLAEVKSRIEAISAISGRMQRVKASQKQPVVVVDYAHTPDALLKALQSLKEHISADESKLICVFGCGGDRDQGKRAQMGNIASEFADELIVTNDNPRTEDANQIVLDILDGVKNRDKVQIETDRQAAIVKAIAQAGEHDIVLIAGKGHEQYQIVGEEKLDYPGDAEVAEQIINRGIH